MEANKIKPGKKLAYTLKKRTGVMKVEVIRLAENNSTWYDGIDLDTKKKVSARLKQLSPVAAAA